MVLLESFDFFFFFFKQKTAYELRISDWSSDVCSSDLGVAAIPDIATGRQMARRTAKPASSRSRVQSAPAFLPIAAQKARHAPTSRAIPEPLGASRCFRMRAAQPETAAVRLS